MQPRTQPHHPCLTASLCSALQHGTPFTVNRRHLRVNKGEPRCPIAPLECAEEAWFPTRRSEVVSIWYAIGGLVAVAYLGAWAVVVFELATAPLVDAHYRVISSRPLGVRPHRARKA